MTPSEKKKKQRQETKQKIAALPPSYIETSAREICRTLINMEEYRRAATIFSFIGRSGEIDTVPILEHALKNGKTLCVPKCVAKGVMEARRITDLGQLEETDFGLLEPGPPSHLILPFEIDFAIIPCLSCDLSGHRLGFGGGYYDRYLQAVSFFKCMICREILISPDIPSENHDIIPDALVTENRVLFFAQA